MRQFEQPREWRERARRNQWGWRQHRGFHTLIVDRDRGCRHPRSLPQERCLAFVRFDEVEMRAGGYGKNQTRQSSAAAEIDGRGYVRWHQGRQLKCVVDMSLGQARLVATADQVDLGVPTQEKVCVRIEPLDCFT